MNRYKATAILIVVTVGYFISYPFHNTLAGGLLTSIFGASMIGGFADWYGISAIFRKPLGIPYKTNIIPKNRQAIFDALSKMVSDELLTKDYLKGLIQQKDLSMVLLQYLEKLKKDKKLKIGVSAIILDFLKGLDSLETGKIVATAITHSLSKIKITSILTSTVELSIKRGHSTRIINFIIDQFGPFIKSRDFHIILFELVEKVKSTYEKGSKRRAFINSVVLEFLLKLSSEKMASLIQIRLGEYLNDFKDPLNEDRLRFEGWINKKILSLKEDHGLQEKIDIWIIEQIGDIEIGSFLAQFIQNLKDKKLHDKGAIKRLAEEVETILESIIDRFESNKEMQKSIDESLKKALDSLVENIHENIGIMVKENLNKYSDEDIVELIESKVGDDLQLVRINGSLVGGLVGMGIFLITFWIK